MAKRVTPPSRSEAFRAEVDVDLTPTDRVLLDEACRLMDRIDHFDRLLSGESEAWSTVADFEGNRPSVLVISSLVSESRQHATELRQVLKALASSDPAKGAVPVVSELNRLRARRNA